MSRDLFSEPREIESVSIWRNLPNPTHHIDSVARLVSKDTKFHKVLTKTSIAIGVVLAVADIAKVFVKKKSDKPDGYIFLRVAYRDEVHRSLLLWLASEGKDGLVTNTKEGAAIFDYVATNRDFDSHGVLFKSVPDSSSISFIFKGEVITIQRESTRLYGDKSNSSVYMPESPMLLGFPYSKPHLIDEFLSELSIVWTNRHASGEVLKNVFLHTRSGHWHQGSTIPSKVSLSLPDDQLERIVADLSWFLSNEKSYLSFGQPYRRTYLLYGLPRTGKTATVRYLASKFKRDVYLLSMSVTTSSNFMSLVNSVPTDAILFIDDIDSGSLDLRGNDKHETDGVGLDQLLTSFDGLAAQEGRILFLACNDRESLPEKLLSPGRVDYEQEFTYATAEQIRKLAVGHAIPPSIVDEAIRECDGKKGMSVVTAKFFKACVKEPELDVEYDIPKKSKNRRNEAYPVLETSEY